MTRIVPLILWMFAGSFLGLAFIGDYLLSANYGYDHGYGEGARCNLAGAIIGCIVQAYVEKFCRWRVYPAKTPTMHYSLRELLIATALVAVALGVLTWAIRQ
jgi:hypothetical protein